MKRKTIWLDKKPKELPKPKRRPETPSFKDIAKELDDAHSKTRVR